MILLFYDYLMKTGPNTTTGGVDCYHEMEHDGMPCGTWLTHYKSLQSGHIMIGIEKHTVRYFPISSSSAGFLVVTLHRFRKRCMNHKSHIRFVNSHSKRNCCTDNLELGRDRHFLNQDFLNQK